MYDLTSAQRDLLYIVNGLNTPSGLEIKKEYQPHYPRDLTHGRLYPNLDTLVDKGLIRKLGAGRQNKYEITDRGCRELETRRDWQKAHIQHLDPPESESDTVEEYGTGSPHIGNSTQSLADPPAFSQVTNRDFDGKRRFIFNPEFFSVISKCERSHR